MNEDKMNSFMASMSVDVFNALLTAYFQEISLLSASQELSLTSMLLEEDSDEVSLEADVLEDTLQ